MSTAINPPPPPRLSKSKKAREREKERNKLPLPTGSERLKTVVRRLPPNLPEEIFWQSVQEWVSDDTTTWKSYHLGKFKRRLNKENVPSRAYIAFKTAEMVMQFAKAFDGHVFKDKSGNESMAVVEFAPYQKVPNEKKKPDARIGTIEKDEDFISFIETLNMPTEPVTIEQLLAATQPVPQPKTTPLLEALKAERERQKEKEIVVRSIQQAPKKDPKQKVVPTPPAAQKQDPPKKAGKNAKKNAPPVPVPTVQPTPPLKAPKAPRAMRLQQQQQQQQAQQQAAPQASPSKPPVNANVPQSPQAGASAASPARRGRPILGLGSRQFEAALSGVGGRKREEKEKDAQSQQEPEPLAPVSPKKQRNPSDAPPTGPGTLKVPSILKRSPVVATKSLDESASSAETAPKVNDAPVRGGGRGRRGRGRGRGGFVPGESMRGG